MTNFHLLSDTGSLSGPEVGDKVRLKSVNIPNNTKQVDVLIMSKVVSEQTVKYQGVSFEE